MKGDWPSFNVYEEGEGGSASSGENDNTYVNGQDYNTAGSNKIRQVESVITVSNIHSMPLSSAPNSVMKNYREGKLLTERYFDGDGRPYLDIDYSDHGNPSTHPDVPHEHTITFDDNNKIHRGKGERTT